MGFGGGPDDRYGNTDPYYLEVIYDTDKKWRVPLHLTSLERSQPFALSVDELLWGGAHIVQRGTIVRTFQLSGMTLPQVEPIDRNEYLLPPGVPPDGIVGMSGDTAIAQVHGIETNRQQVTAFEFSGQRRHEFIENIFAVYSQFHQGRFVSHRPQMIFYMPHEGEMWQVEPASFNVHRLAISSVYTITLIAYGQPQSELPQIAKKSETTRRKRPTYGEYELPAIVRAILAAAEFIQDIKDTYRAANDLARRIDKAINDAVELVGAVLDIVRGATQFVVGLVNAVRSMVDTLVSLVKAIEDTWSAIVNFPADLLSAVVDMKRSFERIGRSPAIMSQAAVRAGNRLGNLSSALVTASPASPVDPVRGEFSVARSGLVGSGFDVNTPVSPYTVGVGDTLQSIALRLTGDAADWRTLAAINGLRPPYITPSGLPGTIRPGQSLLIPRRTSETAVVGRIDLAEQFEEQVYKRDLALTAPDQLTTDISVRSDRLALAEVSGFKNFQQGMLTILLTDAGTNLAFPGMGIGLPIGETVPRGLQQFYAQSAIGPAFRRDSRVREARVIRSSYEKSGELHLAVNVSPVGSGEELALPVAVR